jgi:predicted metal-dependent enzyme (double-stranded beta helix superfamily)
MRWILTALLPLVLQTPPADKLPPAYPRPGATKILDNARVQVWNIAWLKGVQYPLHRHLYDLAGVYYAPGDRMIISPEGTKRPVSTKAGDIAFQRKGVTHIEEGTSDAPLRAVFVELKEDAASGKIANALEDAPPTPAGIGLKKLTDNDRVTVWSYSYGFGMDGPRHRHDVDTVVVWITDGTPHVAWVPAGTVHSEENVGVISEATIFEIK